MASRLTKSMYGWDPDPKKNLFGISNHQVRANSVINNAGWYNDNGDRLGIGDLSLVDMQRISVSLSATEIFYVLTESDSIWDMPADLDRNSPGKDYVVQNAAWIVLRSKILRIKDDPSLKGFQEEVVRNVGGKVDVTFRRINSTDFHESISYFKQKDLKNKEIVLEKAKAIAIDQPKSKPLSTGIVYPAKPVLKKAMPAASKPLTTPVSRSRPLKKKTTPAYSPTKTFRIP